MNTARINRTRGFTLLEIMVALFLLSFVVAAVYASWTAVVRGSQVGTRAAAEVQRSRMAVRTLEDALICARMFSGAPEYYTFEAENGSEPTLSFVAQLSRSFPRSGKFGDFDVRRVTFSVEAAPDSGRQLVLRQNPIFMEMDEDEQSHPLVLAKDVKKLEMEFWEMASSDWVDEWTQTNQMPAMVRITLSMGDQGQSQERQITRTVALPSMAVPAAYQTPGAAPGGQPLPQPGGGRQRPNSPFRAGQR